ncbi:Ubiquitin carboxyl-terminal hydrolase isozyme L5 [Smittium mucronatum]|uniref:Ubiquitin carboxyl-terminal hydrolase n=1 Tax=Smittium mucronatum TaxID=133383 RepID=A0A1R0GYH4_9FUNG|nr:Ubiquitin carboxyl-terminal hydrolase isozyme L5 [Smittium mucronatum]
MNENGNWCLIESDPGVFTELITNMGVKGVQAEEIYSLDYDFSSLEHIYGIVFLFKWENGQDSSQPEVSPTDNFQGQDILFINQIVQNACATQALLSILLNSNDLVLGDDLDNFKDFIVHLDPYSRGLALTNSESIRRVHNSFATQQLIVNDNPNDSKNDQNEDLFHFVAYIPSNGGTYKLDGLSQGPVRVHDPKNSGKSRLGWINDAIYDIKKKISSIGDGSDIRFNLMAITKDCRIRYSSRLEQIELDLKNLQVQLEQLSINNENDSSRNLADSIHDNISKLIEEKLVIESKIDNQNRKLQNYSIENARRKHNFVPMIILLIEELARKNLLQQAIDNAKK